MMLHEIKAWAGTARFIDSPVFGYVMVIDHLIRYRWPTKHDMQVYIEQCIALGPGQLAKGFVPPNTVRKAVDWFREQPGALYEAVTARHGDLYIRYQVPGLRGYRDARFTALGSPKLYDMRMQHVVAEFISEEPMWTFVEDLLMLGPDDKGYVRLLV